MSRNITLYDVVTPILPLNLGGQSISCLFRASQYEVPWLHSRQKFTGRLTSRDEGTTWLASLTKHWTSIAYYSRDSAFLGKLQSKTKFRFSDRFSRPEKEDTRLFFTEFNYCLIFITSFSNVHQSNSSFQNQCVLSKLLQSYLWWSTKWCLPGFVNL